MEINVTKVDLEAIQAFRILFLHENNFQFIYNKCHLYGWADTYLFTINNVAIGYGSVWGQHNRQDRDTIFEFFVIETHRGCSNVVFQNFNAVAKATHIGCQSNDLLLSAMMYEYAQNVNAEAILFEDQFQTRIEIPGVILQKNIPEADSNNYDRQYVLFQNNEIVASGGLMLNYNMPYADLYYEVSEHHRRKGFGTLMLQELKKEASLLGRVPTARCNIRNTISKSALLKAGFKVCGFILTGAIKIY